MLMLVEGFILKACQVILIIQSLKRESYAKSALVQAWYLAVVLITVKRRTSCEKL